MRPLNLFAIKSVCGVYVLLLGCLSRARFQHENLWSCAISSDSTKYWLRNSKTHLGYTCTLRVNSALMIMARWLLQLAFFSFFVTGEIEENCNMQLQVAKTGNANQNGNPEPLEGYDATVGSRCPSKGLFKNGISPEACRDFCEQQSYRCNFFLTVDGMCRCCANTLRSKTSQPFSRSTKAQMKAVPVKLPQMLL